MRARQEAIEGAFCGTWRCTSRVAAKLILHLAGGLCRGVRSSSSPRPGTTMYMNAAPAAGYSPAKQKAEPVEVTYDGVPDDVNMDLGAVDAHVRSGFVQKVF